jgi:hypothetical protein
MIRRFAHEVVRGVTLFAGDARVKIKLATRRLMTRTAVANA